MAVPCPRRKLIPDRDRSGLVVTFLPPPTPVVTQLVVYLEMWIGCREQERSSLVSSTWEQRSRSERWVDEAGAYVQWYMSLWAIMQFGFYWLNTCGTVLKAFCFLVYAKEAKGIIPSRTIKNIQCKIGGNTEMISVVGLLNVKQCNYDFLHTNTTNFVWILDDSFNVLNYLLPTFNVQG